MQHSSKAYTGRSMTIPMLNEKWYFSIGEEVQEWNMLKEHLISHSEKET